jgi:hypothetical protein
MTHRSTYTRTKLGESPTTSTHKGVMQVNSMLPTLPNVHWAPPCDIHPHSMHHRLPHCICSTRGSRPPARIPIPPKRYETRRRMFETWTGDVEGVDIELESSIRPATRGQTGGQDQGPPLPGHRDGPEQAFRGLKRGERRISRGPKCNGGGQHT